MYNFLPNVFKFRCVIIISSIHVCSLEFLYEYIAIIQGTQIKASHRLQGSVMLTGIESEYLLQALLNASGKWVYRLNW